MANRRARNERADESPRGDARERARRLLSRAGIEVDPLATDVDLADRLLRHLTRGNDAWRDTAVELLMPDAMVEAKAFLLRECYFLEGWKVAEEAVARLIVDARIGAYDPGPNTPLARLRRAIRSATIAHLADPDFCIIPPPKAGTPELPRHRIAHEIAKLANIADDLTRRIVWRTWIDKMELRAAAASVGMPLETVEQVMIRLGTQAHDRIGRRDAYREWLSERPPEGYPKPRDEDENEDDRELEEGAS